MSHFKKIKDPLNKFKKGYQRNNPNLLKHLESKLINGEPFHYLFLGTVGCGKTYLARNIMYCSLSKWERVKVHTFYQEYLGIMSSNSFDKFDALNSHNRAMQSESLLIDDLGDEKPSTEAAHDYFGGLIERRYDYLDRKVDISRTIITTNLNGDQIDNTYGSRVLDRLKHRFVICKFNDISFRDKKKEVILG
tara:strand:+ start:2413 stop:2988 length:576 start_codon:yes stop_codon:yes gene_type:complete